MPNEKPSDQLVDAKAILDAITELKRRGNDAVMQELESIEKELASYILEEGSLIYQILIKTGAKAKLVRRLIGRIEAMALVSILALRKAQYRLWREDPQNSALSDGPSSIDE